MLKYHSSFNSTFTKKYNCAEHGWHPPAPLNMGAMANFKTIAKVGGHFRLIRGDPRGSFSYGPWGSWEHVLLGLHPLCLPWGIMTQKKKSWSTPFLNQFTQHSPLPITKWKSSYILPFSKVSSLSLKQINVCNKSYGLSTKTT